MKSAEDWIDSQTGLQTSRTGAITWVQQIQADALNEAKNICEQVWEKKPGVHDQVAAFSLGYSQGSGDCSDAISSMIKEKNLTNANH